ncbi:ferredoxin [Pandoraea terrae]|uniref:Ferredoxin n=2 Tax=Pandoraea terrae TaxID=1537710 RepID=A0A5E4VG38_9BURK|nr:4Fe-4S binding protein [Pandoraea terrae]VVE11056.1 ferredoxin [Pandoraea terrae]
MSIAVPVPAFVPRVGLWMQRHGNWIRGVQWVVVLAYAFLIGVPVFLPLPDETAHIWTHLTVFAQFVFWGIWWPFVLISMVLLGRVWCGVLCPEGTLSEFASRHGRGWAIPRWMRWGGWPFVAFAGTTLYGQMVSVYQYPKAVLLVLGGSTVGAMVVGYFYGRDKRVWCKYLCPVNGVFSLLSRLSPFHFKVNEAAWRASYHTNGRKIIPVNCAPLVPLRNMKGAADCHMCGRCAGHRGAIALAGRSPSEEIVTFGDKDHNSLWDSTLLMFGLLGVAIGAFHWTVNPWFVYVKEMLATWLIDRNIMWPFETNAPWWVFTNYPAQNDVFSWLDGALVVAYILGNGLVLGLAFSAIFAVTNRAMGPWRTARFNHLVQALIPIAGAGVFIGLSATTINLLRAEHLPVGWANDVRAAILAATTLWSLWLGWRVTGRHATSWLRRVAGMTGIVAALALVNWLWLLMFWLW